MRRPAGDLQRDSQEEQRIGILWALLASYLPEDVKSIEKFFVHHVEYTLARYRGNINSMGAYRALAMSVRDRLIERWKDTQLYFKKNGVKRVAYLSMEYLVGRSLQNAIINLGLEENFGAAMNNLGYVLEDLYEQEADAGLGYSGLGRLAACFMDSMATMDYPAWGYGLRYKYGMFYQKIKNGAQLEFPDYWLENGNPWEVERLDIMYPIHFYGYCKSEIIDGKNHTVWYPKQKILAVAYDTPIPGYSTYNTLNLRLWSAQPSKEFDLEVFNSGDLYDSLGDRSTSDRITAVLYPNDSYPGGKELRLKQQYFMVSATIQDLLRRFRESKRQLTDLPELVSIQLNDTHPTLAAIELLRILIDVEGLLYEESYVLISKIFSFTNHSVQRENVEKWPVDLMDRVLPRHLQLIYQINHHFLELVSRRWPNDQGKMTHMSIIEEGLEKHVRMANLAIVISHHVNGVAEIHSEMIRTEVFPDFFKLWPEKFLSITNGVTPRRWLLKANNEMSNLITKWLRTSSWILNFDIISDLARQSDVGSLQKQWSLAKQINKERLCDYISTHIGINIPVDSLFDVQIKRVHQYKRQLLNIIYVIHRYNTIKHMSPEEKKRVTPRVVIFAGKAAPNYEMGKMIIQLINNVSVVVNADKSVGELLKVVFIPNYCVSIAELIIPAADISQHISTAGGMRQYILSGYSPSSQHHPKSRRHLRSSRCSGTDKS